MAERRKRRRFTAGFEAEAVKRLLEGGKGRSEAATELGISPGQLSGWRNEHLAAGSAEALAARKAELQRLKRENKRLEEGVEILRKAAAARTVRCPSERGVSWSASDHSSPPDPPQVLPAGTRAAGWDRPTGRTALQGTHNAPMGSFFASLKKEHVHHVHFRTRAEARAAVFEYVEVFYNRQRLHSALGYRTPAEARAGMEGIDMRAAA